MGFWADVTASHKLRKEVADLRGDVEQLERHVKNIRLEWEESYDKLTHLMARVTKRQKPATDDQAPPTDAKSGDPASPILGNHERLSAMRGRLHGVLPR